jgi:hypothetical protein
MATTPVTVTLTCRAHPSPHVRMQATGDEAVLLDLASEYYFGLNAVGKRVWELLSANPHVQTAFDALQSEYDVDAAQLERDLLALLQQLADAGLVRIE